MAKSVLGFDIGTDRVKVVEIKKTKVVRFVNEDLPDGIVVDGQIVAWDALYDFMTDIMKKGKFGTKVARLVIPDSQTFTLHLATPFMYTKQLLVNLPYEFRDFITSDKENYIYDYEITGFTQDENGNDTGLEIIAVAVEKSLMDHYKDLFKKLRLKLEMATPQCLCFDVLMERIDNKFATKDFAIIDLGFSATRINIFSDGVFDTARTIETSCRDIVAKIADIKNCHEKIAAQHMMNNADNILEDPQIREVCSSIAVDVMRAVNYYSYEKRENNLETIYVCGGGAAIKPLIEELIDNVPLKVEMLSDLTENQTGKSVFMNGPAAAGICWNGEGE